MTISNAYKLRAMQEEDIPSLAQVHSLGRTSYFDFVKQSDLEQISYNSYLNSRQKLSADKDNKVMTLVATFNDQVIGFCDYGFLSEDNFKRADYIETLKVFKGELINLFLHPDHQGNGVGGQLFDEARRVLNERQLMPFMLWTLRENKRARTLYEKKGGVVVKDLELPVQFGQNEYPQVAYRFDG